MVDDRNETPDTPVAAGEGTAPITLNAAGVSTLTVPHGAMLLNAQFARAGTELQLTGQNGEQVMVQNFFGTEMAPVLMTEGGGKIMPDVAEALAGPDILGGGEGDATLMGQSDQPIGTVDTAEGGVFATRADGTRVELNEGDPVYQGDVLETDDTGAVSVTFIDNTEFALDEGARMTLDEMVFDANTGEGSSTFTVVQGVFTFVSGQVAKSGSDAMTVNTPVATIGIRGTKVAIKAGSEDEDTVITLLQEDSGHIGEIAVTNDAGTQVLNQANQTVFIESALVAPTQPAILPSEQLRSIFTDNANDTRGLWRYEEGEQGRNDGGDLEQTIDEAKEAAAEEGADEDTVDNAEAAAELAFELALAEGLDEEEALQEAAEAFQNALVDQGAADSLIETAAGGDDAGGPDDDFGGGDSVFDYNPSAGFGGTQGGLSQGGGGPGAPVTGFQPTSQNNTVFDPVIRGGAGDDTLTGTEGDDQFDAGAGNDTINALGGDDIVDAGAGNDTVFGGAGDDTIDGGTGNDTLHGGADDDDISGGAGNDTIFGGTGDDDIEGGDGNDTIFGGAGEDNIDAGDGDDFIGTSDDDGSDDVYDGGDGIDTVSFAADTEGVTVNLDEDDNDEFDIDANTARGDATGEDEIENVENIVTGSGDDVIIGQTGEANTINAGAGDDLVIGGEGDTLIGGAGTDTLRISMTRAEFEDPAFQAEVAAYRADPSTPFHFNSIDMDVETFELLQIEVDGTIIAAEPPTLSVGDVYGVEDSAILLGLGASLNDTDGAEVLEVQVSGLPEGSTLHFIDDNGVAQSIAITDGEGSIEISGASQALLDTLAVTPPAGDSGDFQINVTATAVEADGSISSVSDSFNVIVNGIPTVLPDSIAGTEDAGVLVGSLTDDIGGEGTFDRDSDDLEFSIDGVTADANGDYVVATPEGTLTLHADGTYEFAIDASQQSLDDGESAVAQFTIVATDNGQPVLFDDNTLTVTITGSNDGPVASAELVTGGEDAGQLTGNLDATDIDGDDLTFSLQGDGEGEYGQLTVNADGSYTFDIGDAAQGLDDGESAVETFTYEVTDGDVVSTQTIQVTITGSNDGPVAQAEAVSGSEDAGQLTGNLAATDIDGDSLTFSLDPSETGTGQYGDLTVNADGSYTFDLNAAAQTLDDGETAVETFTYQVSDGDETVTQAIQVTITGSNDAPVATAETIAGTEDSGVLSGNLDATDIDGENVTFTVDGHTPDANGVTTVPVQGTVGGQTVTVGLLIVAADGAYTFTPDNAALQGLGPDDQVQVDLTFTASDGTASDSDTLSITLQGTDDNLVALAEIVQGTEDSSVLTGNLDATDPEGGEISFGISGVEPDGTTGATTVAVQGTVNGETVTVGQLVVQQDGSYAFTPDNAALQGLDDGEEVDVDLTFTASDGANVSENTLSITLTGSNDGPVATAEVISGGEDAGQLTGNLEATDVEGDDLTFSLQGDGEGQYGQLTVNADGSYTFDIAEAAQGLDDGESAVETFTYEVTDGDVTSTQTISVTITGSNDGPVAQAEFVTGSEDAGTVTGNLTATDIDGDDLTFGLASGEDGAGQYGTLTVNADGSYSFAVNENAQSLDDGETAVETFTYQVSDGDETVTQTISVAITGSNDGPIAQAEAVTGGEDAGQLSGNLDATDVEGDDLTFSLQGDGAGQYGQLTVNADGSYTFDIAEAAQGLDDGESAVETFTYEVSDGDVTTTQTIQVTITGSNDGPVAQAESVSGGEDAGQLTGNLDAADVDGDDLTFSLQGDGEGQFGQLTVNADGSYTFDIAEAAQGLDDGESAVETFTYEVTDGDVTSTQTITVTITGSNDGPVAQAESVSGTEDAGQLTGNLDAADVDGDDLTFSLQGDGEGQYGQLTVNTDGSYTFDIASNAQSLDDGESVVETFTYEVTDGDVVSTQTIQVTITGSNDGPVAQAETVTGTEDAGQLTGNLDAADVDGDDLTFSLQGDGEGQYGQLTVNADGSYTFDIADAAQGLDDGESAVETFTYEVTDGDVVSTQTITVTITGSNDGPVAQAETVSGNEDAGQLTGNLDAADVDGDELTFSLQGDGEGQYGQLTVNADGSYTFDIAEAAQGLDDGESAVETFTYEVTDGDVTSTQTITVTITGSNDGPVAQAETVAGNEDAGQLTGNLDAADVDGDDLTFSLQGDGEGQYGQLTVNADGSYTFDIAEAAQGLDDGESAVETFTYEVTDGDVTSTQTITVTITGSNDGPVAQAEAVSGSEDAGQLTGNLDAADVDGDDLTFSLQGDGEGQYGQLTVNADGSYTFDIADAAQGLDDGESAVETFTYEVTDGDVTSTQTITVTITGSNDGPVAQAETVTGNEDAGQLTGNLDAADVDGDDLTFSLQGDGEGQYGQLTVNADGSYTFDIAEAAQGLDDGESAAETFTYEVTDGDVTTTQTITVTITGSNDGPVAQAETVTGNEDAGQLTGNLDAADVDGDDLTFSLQGDGEGQYGQLTVNADGSYTFDIAEAAQGLDDGESAVETFTYEVTDGDVVSTQTITVTITGSNDGPVA
ncbi:MAG: VCBS domain-containing protein, partial [Alphaproteobacteria bacterium]